MEKVTPQKLSYAEDRRRRAQERRDRAANNLWELMGFGEHYKIKRAEASVESANKELALAEQNLERVQSAWSKQQETGQVPVVSTITPV